ncbi:hypothetical protein WMY93_012891 [Mugilogobius chulae]|uniref:LRAT domain-containing protein n=1 Tax=Mugilogobius chulae TaxID=88201 RepID=A0AAW0NXY7_9GOBI
MAFPTWPTYLSRSVQSLTRVDQTFTQSSLCLCSRNKLGLIRGILNSDSRLVLFGRALRSEVKLDPLLLLGKNYKVNNMLDDSFPARDFHGVVKPAIDDLIGREMTFDILYHNSEHQATMLRYGVKKSSRCVRREGFGNVNGGGGHRIEKVYEAIMPAWKKEFENKTL